MSGRLGRFVRAVFPGLVALGGYRREWLRADLVAGLTLAAYLIPAGLGDASLAGLPAEAGLYACLFGGLVFWIFCTSQHAAVTVTSAISLLIGSSLQHLDRGDPSRHAVLAAATAVMVGALGLVAWAVKAGVLVSFISETVLVGFKCGVALHIASSQLPKLFGYSGGHGDFWERAHHFVAHLGETNAAALAVGIGSLAVLLACKKLLPKVPGGLVVVVAGIAISALAGLSARGVKLLGVVPQGLPPFGLPDVGFDELRELLPLAMAAFLLGAVETAAIGRTFAKAYGYRFDANQELLAVAASNAAAGLGSGYPVSAGMSQSLVNESSGARTPISGLVAALVIVVMTLFLSGVLRDLPQPVLAAIILMAVLGLIQIGALKRIWRFSKSEFVVSMVATLGVLNQGLLQGVLIGVVLSLILLLRRESRPYVTELGRIPGTDWYADRARHPDRVQQPDVFVFRLSGSLLYFNAEFVSDRFLEALDARGPEIRLAVFFFGNVPSIDLAGAEAMIELQHALTKRGVVLRLAEVHRAVRHPLKSAGFAEDGTALGKHETVDAVIAAWRGRA